MARVTASFPLVQDAHSSSGRVAANISGIIVEFWRGATKPSVYALAIILTITGALFGACFFVINPVVLSGSFHRYFLAKPNDHYMVVSSTVLAVSREDLPKMGVAILGDSSTRESISSIEELERLIRARTERDYVVHVLATGDQTLWEMGALVHQLGLRFEGIIVLGINWSHLHKTREDLARLVETPRLGFASSVLDDEAECMGVAVSRRTGIFFLDNLRFYLPRIPVFLKCMVDGPPEYSFHQPENRTQVRDRSWQQRAEQARKKLSESDALFEQNLAVLTRIVNLARSPERRISFVLLDAPQNPKFIGEAFGWDEYRSYQERLQAFAAQHDLTYWALNERAQLREGEYRDHCHIRSDEARDRYSLLLATDLAGLSCKTDLTDVSR